MILWLVLFLLIIAISLTLAYQSMKDFSETPGNLNTQYSLFLIRNPAALTVELLKTFWDQLSKEARVISLERLFKGKKSALVIFGPKNLLVNQGANLNLLELEDYTNVEEQKVTAWEVRVRVIENLFNFLPDLNPDEQFWWQVVLQPKGKEFKSQVRAAILSGSSDRRKSLAASLENLGEGKAIKMPRPLTSTQILESYRKRQLQQSTPFILKSEDALKLVLGV